MSDEAYIHMARSLKQGGSAFVYCQGDEKAIEDDDAWTIIPGHVTCPKCLEIMEAKYGVSPQTNPAATA